MSFSNLKQQRSKQQEALSWLETMGGGSFEVIKNAYDQVVLVGSRAYRFYGVSCNERDNSTLDGRLESARSELELNDLAPECYIRVVAIVRNSSGKIKIVEAGAEGDYTVLDYALEMRRFPPEHTMANLLTNSQLFYDDVYSLGAKIAEYHYGRVVVELNSTNTGTGFVEDMAGLTDPMGLGEKTDSKVSLSEIRALVGEKAPSIKAAFKTRSACCFRFLHGNMCPNNVVYIDDNINIRSAQSFGILTNQDIAKDVGYFMSSLYFHKRDDLAAAFLDGYLSVNDDDTIHNVINYWVVHASVVRGLWLLVLSDIPKEKTAGGLYLKQALDFLRK